MLATLVTVPAQAQQPTVPGAPTGLMATADAETNIDLAWTAPADTGGAAITGYRIEVSADGGTTWSDRVADTGSTDTEYSHTGLTHGDTRHYRVSAINSAGTGAASNIVGATAMDTTPPMFLPARTVPTRTDVANGGDEITLAFDEVLNDGAGRTAPASAFTVTADGSSVTVGETLVFGVFVVLILDSLITEGQTVTVSYADPTPGDDPAAVQDFAGNDAASFTDVTIPNNSAVLAAPANLTATAVSATQIDLSWEAPNQGTTEGYKIEVSADGGMTWSVLKSDTGNTDTSYAHTDLTNGDTRHYRVSGVHGNVRALLSNVASATAMDTTPPMFLPARTVPTRTDVANGGDEITLAFDEVLNDGAGRTAPASAFTVTADGSSVTVGETLVFGVFVVLILDSLITETSNRHGELRAIRHDGDDPAAVQDFAGNDAASFTDVTIPNNSAVLAAPANLTATAVSATQIDLSWEAPNQGTTEGYKIEVSADGGMTWSVLKSDTGNTDTSYAHTDLTNGDTRHYRVSGVHGNVRALLSNVASATAMDTTPPMFLPARTVPTRTDVANGGDEITLAFDEVLNDGAGRTAPASAFTVTADGSSVAVGETLVFGVFVVLILDSLITETSDRHGELRRSDTTATTRRPCRISPATTRRPLPM